MEKINKHIQCENPKDYLKLIALEKYIYTIEDLCYLLDMTEQYIQVNYISRLETLYIDKENKLKIRGIISLYKDTKGNTVMIRDTFKELFPLVKLIVDYEEDILRKKVLISLSSVKKLIGDIFKREVKLLDENGEIIKDENNKPIKKLVPLTKNDIDFILSNNLYSTKSLKELLDIKYDTQLYRELSWRTHIKYVCEDNSKKPNRARYYIK